MAGNILYMALRGIVLLSLFFLVSCSGGEQSKVTDTPTSGTIRVGIDHSYTLLAEAQVYAFEAFYRYAKLDTVFMNEADLINAFMNDSLPLIMINRKLTDSEEQYLKERHFNPRTTRVAKDAIAFILNRENSDSTFFFKNIREIFQGKVTRWDQIRPGSDLGKITVVFDHSNSSNPRYLKEKFALVSFPATCSAARNNREVIDFVERNRNAIGVISVNWISDPQDTVSHSFLKRFRVAAIAIEGDNSPNTSFYKPYQGYIHKGIYPFTREVYLINRQTYSGLAYGFSAFVAGEKGQSIMLRSGMVPAAMPVRVVEIRN